MLEIPHCLEHRLTDGGEVISLTRRPWCTQQNFFSLSGIHSYLRLSKPHVVVRLEKLGQF
jgi:hypothetical protein